MAGPRLQRSGLVDHHSSWKHQNFTQTLLGDLAQFSQDFNKPIDFESANSQNYFLPSEDGEFIRNRISQYVNEYLSYHTYSNHTYSSTLGKSMHNPMMRFLSEREEGPWGAPRALAQKEGLAQTTESESPGSRDSINQAARDVASMNWPMAGITMSLVETTTQETDHQAFIQKTVGSCDKVLTQGGVIGLNKDSNNVWPSSRSDVSHTRSSRGAENTNTRQRKCSTYYDGCTSSKSKVKKSPRNGGLSSKTLSVDQPTIGSRNSTGGSKGPSSRRGPKQPHKCIYCEETFQFDARLKSHMAVHNTQKCRCNVCGSEFGRDSSLKRHLNTIGACQKKKEAKLRQTSLPNRPESQSFFEADVAGSITSKSSLRAGSDCVSLDHENRYSMLPPGTIMNHTMTSPRLHETSYAYRDGRLGGYYTQASHMGSLNPRNPPALWGVDQDVGCWPEDEMSNVDQENIVNQFFVYNE